MHRHRRIDYYALPARRLRSTMSASCVPEIKSLWIKCTSICAVHVRQIFSMSDKVSGSSDILPGYHVILIVSLAGCGQLI